MTSRLPALVDRLRGSLWFLPAVAVTGVSALAAGSLALDRRRETSGSWFAFGGSPETARSVLAAVATSIITLTALVFSITVVALQLASSQYSPRVLRNFLRDRPSQVTLATFLATFAYTMLVLRAVRSATASQEVFVPALSVNLAFALTAVSLGLFVFYVHHMAQSMQASTILARIATDTADAIRRLYPEAGGDVAVPAASPRGGCGQEVAVPAPRSGYVQEIDEEAVMAAACRHDLTVRLTPRIGDFVARGTTLLHVRGRHEPDTAERLVAAVAIGPERTTRQDAAFGFRQLVDVAVRALSPGINDPTTAVQALDRIYDLLVLLAPRRLPSPERLDDRGVVRAVLPRPSWDGYVHLAFEEIRHHGRDAIQVCRRLDEVVDDLLAVVPTPRCAALEAQLGRS